MGRENLAVGKAGESLALEFLKRKGYRILATNVRTPMGELDAVARFKGTIVFVEIKTRAGYSLGPPSLSVTKRKKWHIVNNAIFYLKKHDLLECDWRIDVISMNLNCAYELERIEHIESAVEEGYD